MPHVSPGTSDAAELAELQRFPSDWLTSDHTAPGPALTRFTGHPRYDLAQPRNNLDRFTFPHGGEPPFEPSEQ
jgi:hypothetical protein